MRCTCPLLAAFAALAASAPFVDAVRADPFPASLSVSTLDGVNGVRLNGVNFNSSVGWSVSSAGDVNGDGIDDALIGAPSDQVPGVGNAGAVYVVFGRNPGGPSGPFAASIDLSSLNGSNGFRIEAATTGTAFGNVVCRAGDLNGDGLSDIAANAPTAAPGGQIQAGSVFVIFGRNTAVHGPFPASLSLSTLDGANGFRIDSPAILERCGSSLAPAGDVNDDGVDDLLIGAPGSSPVVFNATGRAYLLFGKRTSIAGNFPPVFNLSGINGSNGFRLVGVGTTEECGFAVAGAGDINDDGIPDMAIGARGADRNMLGNSGVTYVVYGTNATFPADLGLGTLTGGNGFRIDGDAEGADSGSSVAFAHDVNGDGVDDLLIGAPGAHAPGVITAGSTFVLFGKHTATQGGFPSILGLGSLNGANGFRIDSAVTNEQTSHFVAGADVNDDGLADVMVSARNSNPPGAALGGSVYVVYGRDTFADGAPFPAAISMAALDGIIGFRINGVAGDKLGSSLRDAGDLNDDGVDDIITGAIGPNPGRAYIVFGRGAAVCEGDTNGDNVVDFLDLNIVLSDFGQTGAPGALQGDLDDDGDCDFIDLNIVLSAFGVAC